MLESDCRKYGTATTDTVTNRTAQEPGFFGRLTLEFATIMPECVFDALVKSAWPPYRERHE